MNLLELCKQAVGIEGVWGLQSAVDQCFISCLCRRQRKML